VIEPMITGSSKAASLASRRTNLALVLPLALAVVACGGADNGAGPGPAPEDGFARVQLEIPTRGTLLPGPATDPLILFDDLPVPSDLIAPLPLTGVKLDAAGQVDLSAGPVIGWGIESGGGSLASSTTEPEQGIVSNQWFLGPLVPGTTQSLVLSAPAAAAYTQPFRVRIFQAPLQVEQSEPGLSGTVGTALPEPLTIRLRDGNGAPLAGVPIVFQSSGTLNYVGETESVPYLTCSIFACQNGAEVVFSFTDANGIAAVTLTLGTSTLETGAGARIEIPVQLEGSQYLTRPAEIGWSITVLPGPTAQVTIQGGNNQAGSAGEALALPLVVKVVDQYGNARVGETVTWAVASGGGSLGAPTTSTSGFGESSNTWTLGGTSGPQTVSASAGPASVTFNAEASGS
jgi:hypothetical protein